MMQDKYVFHFDAGHGWLEVPLSEVRELGLNPHITSCSYMSHDTAYLEEDCDMSLFLSMRFMTQYFDKEFFDAHIIEKYDGNQSRIRNLNRFNSSY